jgi:hypothetical protein
LPPVLEPPKPAETPKPAEPEAGPNPVEQAVQSSLRDRLREMEQAEKLANETPQREPRYAAEPQQGEQHLQHQQLQHGEQRLLQPVTAEQIIASAQLPERDKNWLRSHWNT